MGARGQRRGGNFAPRFSLMNEPLIRFIISSALPAGPSASPTPCLASPPGSQGPAGAGDRDGNGHRCQAPHQAPRWARRQDKGRLGKGAAGTRCPVLWRGLSTPLGNGYGLPWGPASSPRPRTTEEEVGRLGAVQHRATAMIRGRGDEADEERLEELWGFSLEKRSPSADLITIFQSLIIKRMETGFSPRPQRTGLRSTAFSCSWGN